MQNLVKMSNVFEEKISSLEKTENSKLKTNIESLIEGTNTRVPLSNCTQTERACTL